MPKSRRHFLKKGCQSIVAGPLLSSSFLFELANPNIDRDQLDKDQRFELLFDQIRIANMRERYRFDNRWTPLFRGNRALELLPDIEQSKSLTVNDIPDFSEKLLVSAFHTLLTKVSEHGNHSLAIFRGLSGIADWDRVINESGQVIGLDYAAKNVVAQSFALDWIGLLIGSGARGELTASIGSKGLTALERALLESQSDESYTGWRFAGQDKDVVKNLRRRCFNFNVAKGAGKVLQYQPQSDAS